jgi:hypothetical protein
MFTVLVVGMHLTVAAVVGDDGLSDNDGLGSGACVLHLAASMIHGLGTTSASTAVSSVGRRPWRYGQGRVDADYLPCRARDLAARKAAATGAK